MSGCPMSRRRFLRIAGGAAALAAARGAGLFESGAIRDADGAEGPAAVVSVASGSGGAGNARKAVAAIGGMGTFVSRGDVVVVKPNIGWDRTPAQGANTDPEVVVAVAEMCLAAGAKSVRVFDRTCNDARRCYVNSGIRDAVERASRALHAEGQLRIEHVDDRKFQMAQIPNASFLKEWELYRDALDADKFVNVPVAKHHSLAIATLGLKNIMGVMGGNRGQLHRRLADCLADVHRRFPRQLVVIDATRVLVRNGPSGGSLADVRPVGTVFASRDVVAADVVAAERVFGLSPAEVPHLRNALGSGVGVSSPARIRVVGS